VQLIADAIRTTPPEPRDGSAEAVIRVAQFGDKLVNSLVN
jgi:hypothetical protein